MSEGRGAADAQAEQTPGHTGLGDWNPREHFGPGYVPWFVPARSGAAGPGHAWLLQLRAIALSNFSGVRYAGIVLPLLFCGLMAFVNYRSTEPPVPLSTWAWDLACGLLIALLWNWGGWRPFLWLREDCRAHMRHVLAETTILVQVLSLEPSAGQSALWRLVLGPAAHYHPGQPHSFQRRIRAFIRHYPRFARASRRQPYPVSMRWAAFLVNFCGPVITWLSVYGILYWLRAVDEGYELSPRFYIGVIAAIVCGIMLWHSLPELRRSALELAVTDALLGEEEEA